MSFSSQRFERYKVAFIDYQIATANFNEAIFEASKNGVHGTEFTDALAHILAIKHAHFLECARRVLGGREFKSALITRADVAPKAAPA
jgi:hypothetical protein